MIISQQKPKQTRRELSPIERVNNKLSFQNQVEENLEKSLLLTYLNSDRPRQQGQNPIHTKNSKADTSQSSFIFSHSKQNKNSELINTSITDDFSKVDFQRQIFHQENQNIPLISQVFYIII